MSAGTIARLAERLRAELGHDAVITDRTRLLTYECDGLAQYKVTPALVVLPQTTAQVADVVRATPQSQCARCGWPTGSTSCLVHV